MYQIYHPGYCVPYCPMIHNGFSTPYESEIDEEAKDYRTYEEKKPEIQMQNEDDEVYKDDFTPGFVPNHNHGSVDHTSVEGGHVHQCLDITFPPSPSKDNTHIHYTEGYVLFEKGHNHFYKAWSGPAIPVGVGMHVHYYDFYTTVNNGHRHHVSGVDMPAPGTQ